MRHHRWIVATVAVVASATLVFVACFGPDSPAGYAGPPRQAEPFELKPEEKRIVDIFREASPSVVFISSNVLVRSYFSRSVDEMPYGAGSGFIWDKQGHVVTNFHVVRDYVQREGRGMTLTVTMDDQSKYKVEEVVGVYVDKELAVLRIAAPPEKLHPIHLGTSRTLLVGQTTLAIGNPFGLDRTLTVGIVSALGREIQALSGRRISDVIQTDAAINPGNSGGPLLNSSGQLIGMNTAILSPSGVNAGIGFAIPGDIVRRYVDQMIKTKGKVSGAGLGIRPFPDSTAKSLGLVGVLIERVFPDGAADKAGLQGTRFHDNGDLERLGDVITAIGSDKVSDFDGLRDALEKRAVGDEVEVTVSREGKEKKVKALLQEIEL